MGSLSVFVVLALTAATVLICSQAAPVTEFFGPPQTIEGDRNVNFPNPDQGKKVEEMERFHRTYKNGTVEFKMALNNGHVQYQRISSKILDGDKIQVFEGYISEQYKDGRYGTRYYAADENGYRSSPVIVENNPPKLPSSGPYAISNPRDNENEQPSLGEEDIQTKTKTLEDNLVEIENDLEEELLRNLNLGSGIIGENSISTTESEILKQEKKEDTLEQKNLEEHSVLQYSQLPIDTDNPLLLKPENNFDKVSEEQESSTLPAFGENSSTDIERENSIATTESEEVLEKKNGEEALILQNSDLPYSTESPYLQNSENNFDKVSEMPELSPLPALGENSNVGVETDSISTDRPSSEEQNNVNKLEISSEPPILDATQSFEEELRGRSLHSSSSSHILSEGLEDTKELYQEPIVPAVDVVPNFEVSTQLSTDEIPEATTDARLNDEITSTEHTISLNNEDQEARTNVPEINEIKTDGDTSSVYRYPTEKTVSDAALSNEDHEPATKLQEIDEIKAENEIPTVSKLEESTKLPIHEVSETTAEAGTSTEQPISFNNEEQESNTEVPLTSSFAPNIDNTETNTYSTEKSNSEEFQREDITELPLEEHFTETKKVSNESDDSLISDKQSRNFDVSNEFPLLENNSTSIAEGSGIGDISDISKISEINEQTTNKIEISTEQSESTDEDSNPTTISDVNKLENTTTEAEILSTTENNNITAISTERNDDNITDENLQISTEQPSVSSEEKSSETSTELPEESIEENDSTENIIELTSEEPEVISTTQETEVKSHGVNVEFPHPMFYY